MTDVLKRASFSSALEKAGSTDSMDEEDAQSFVLTLQRSLSEDLLMLTLYRIKEKLNNDAEILHAFVEEKLESFMKNMKEILSEASVIPSMFKVLQVIARSEGFLPTLLSNQVDRYVMDAFHSTSADLPVLEGACSLLMEIKKDQKVQDTLYSVNFLSTTLVPLMTSHPSSPVVVTAGMELFCLFCEKMFADTPDEEEFRSGKQWCEIILTAMHKLMDYKNVQILSCKAITELLKACQSASSEIGENVINNIPQCPLHSMCVGNILMYKTDVDVFTVACEALYWLG